MYDVSLILDLPLVSVRIVQRKMNHAFQTNVSPANVHSVDFWYTARTRNGATNCSDFHMQILYQILGCNLECCTEHDCYKRRSLLVRHGFTIIHKDTNWQKIALTLCDKDFHHHIDKHRAARMV